MKEKVWRSKGAVFFSILIVLLPFAQFFINGLTAIALTNDSESNVRQLFDNEYGKASLSYQTNENEIIWQLNIDKESATKATQFLFSLKDKENKSILPTLSEKNQATDHFTVISKETEKDYATVFERKPSNTDKNYKIEFSTPIVSALTFKVAFNAASDQTNEQKTLFTKEYPISIKENDGTQTSTEETVTSATKESNDGSSTESSATGEETTSEVKDLGDADEATVNSAKKDAEKKYEETGVPQKITRSAALSETPNSNGSTPKYNNISYSYPEKNPENSPLGILVNDAVKDPNNQNLNDVNILNNITNFNYDKNNSDEDNLRYQDHGGSVEINGNTYDAHTYLHKSIKETNTQGLFDVTIKVKGDSYNPPKPLDIVLVFDKSYSMYSNHRIDKAKDAANSFIDSMLKANLDENQKPYENPPINISIVTFDTVAEQKTLLTADKEALKKQIRNIPGQNGSWGGNTNLQAGIIVGGEVLDTGRKDVDKVMVVLNDGAPSQTYVASSIDTSKKIPILQQDDITEPESLPGGYVRFPVREYPGILTDFKGINIVRDEKTQLLSLGSPSKGPGFHLYNKDSSNTYDKKDVKTPFQSYEIKTGTVTDVVNDHIWPTISQAKIEQSKGTTIYALGIELTKDEKNGNGVVLNSGKGYVPTMSSTKQAINTLKNLATPSDTNAYYTSADNVDELSKKLQQVSDDINKTINKGVIVDQLSKNVIYQPGTIKAVVKTKEGETTPKPQVENEKIEEQLKEPAKISLGDLTLGKNETATITYQVRINTERPDFQPDYFYLVDDPSLPPTLQPLGDRNTKLPFPIQSVKAPGVSLNVTKNWVEENSDSSIRPENITFKVSRSEGVNKDTYPFDDRSIKLSGTKTDSSWSKKDISKVQDSAGNDYYLPRFNNKGENFSYSLEEVDISGYKATNSIVNGVSNNGKNSFEFEFTNTLKTVNLNLEKKSETGQVLEGTQFDLMKDKTIIKKDLVTSNSGRLVLENLTPGKYTLAETKSTSGYSIDGLKINFEVTSQMKVVLSEPKDDRVSQSEDGLTLTIINHLKPFDLDLTKIDSFTGKPIEGAVFSLSDSIDNPKITITSSPTDKNGKIKLNFNETLPALLAGKTYYLKEETAPGGYKKLSGYFELNIDKSGKAAVAYVGNDYSSKIEPIVSLNSEENVNTITFPIENESKVPLPATGGIGVWLIYGAGITALIVGVGYYFLRNKSKGEA